MIGHRWTRVLAAGLMLGALAAGYGVATTLAQATDATVTLTDATTTPTSPTTPTGSTSPTTPTTPTSPTTPTTPKPKPKPKPTRRTLCSNFVATTRKIGQVRISSTMRALLAIRSLRHDNRYARLQASRSSNRGRVLPTQTWRSVTYYVDGRKIRTSRTRPYRIMVKLAALRVGTHKAYIKVDYVNHGPTKTHYLLVVTRKSAKSCTCVLKVLRPARAISFDR